MTRFILAKTFQDRLEADIAKGALEANGVNAKIFADDEGGMAPFPMQPSTAGVRLFVEKSKINLAKKILK